MHFKKRSSLRITSKFLIIKERVVFMSVTEKDIRDCLDASVEYGTKLKENLKKDRTKYKQIIETKAANVEQYSPGFSKAVLDVYGESINFESKSEPKLTFEEVKQKIDNIVEETRKKISDKSTLDKFNRAAKSIKSQINASKYGVDVINKTKTALAECKSKLNRILGETEVDPQITIAGKTCNFRKLSDTLQKTLTEDNNLDFLNELEKPTTTDTIIQAFRKEGAFIYNKELAADTKPLPKKYISEYRESLVVYGKAIQSYLKVNRRFCQAGIKEEVETLVQYLSSFSSGIATAHKTDMDLKSGASADKAKGDIHKAIEGIKSEFIKALEQTKNNVDALIDKHWSVSNVEKDEEVEQWHKYCSDQLKEIQEHTKINPDVKIGEKTYKFIDLIDAVKTSVVNDPKSDILAVLASKSFENSIISSFIDAGVYVTER